MVKSSAGHVGTREHVSTRDYVSKRVGPGKREIPAAESADLAAVYDKYRQDVLREGAKGKGKSKKPGSHAA